MHYYTGIFLAAGFGDFRQNGWGFRRETANFGGFRTESQDGICPLVVMSVFGGTTSILLKACPLDMLQVRSSSYIIDLYNSKDYYFFV